VENKNTLTVENFKLLCLSDSEMTDEEIRVYFGMVPIKSEEEILEICNILHKYRPKVEKKLVSGLNRKKHV